MLTIYNETLMLLYVSTLILIKEEGWSSSLMLRNHSTDAKNIAIGYRLFSNLSIAFWSAFIQSYDTVYTLQDQWVWIRLAKSATLSGNHFDEIILDKTETTQSSKLIKLKELLLSVVGIAVCIILAVSCNNKLVLNLREVFDNYNFLVFWSYYAISHHYGLRPADAHTPL